MVGPSNSGKSTFANEALIPALEQLEVNGTIPNIQYISSDAIRRDLLGNYYNKHDARMSEVSEPAFDILFQKLDAVTKYPINAEFVVVDTTGLHEKFRERVLDLADANGYAVEMVLFDYKDIGEYFKFSENDNLRRSVVADGVDRLRRDVLKKLNKTRYRHIHKIKSKDFMANTSVGKISNLEVVVSDWEQYIACILDNSLEWVTIGDVHGCINELKALLIKIGFEIIEGEVFDGEKTKNLGILFIGDLVDKAPNADIAETLLFVERLKNKFGSRVKFILGNHEEMVWKWVTNDKSLEVTPERLDQKEKYYNTAGLLESDEALKNVFLKIYDSMLPWAKWSSGYQTSFIATHAPCETKYLGKMDRRSIGKQYKCTSRSKNVGKSNDELTPYLTIEANSQHPRHVFGHMGQGEVRSFKNKFCIDSGCIYGGTLTAFFPCRNKVQFRSVKYMGDHSKSNDFNSPLFSSNKKEVKNFEQVPELSDKDAEKLHKMIKAGVSYIGGTISPADKDVGQNELESLQQGINYFRGKVDKVILEPKYMGSRAQVYLDRDIDKCYATSRNGFKIKTDLSGAFHKLMVDQEELLKKYVRIELDAELMPWSALGSGLIDYTFRSAQYGLNADLDFLNENGFEEEFESLLNRYKAADFKDDSKCISKKELVDKYGHDYNNFKLLENIEKSYVSLEEHFKAAAVYNSQVDLYSDEAEPYFKPFRILRAWTEDGRIEHPFDNVVDEFSAISDDGFFVLDLTDHLGDDGAEMWYEKITTVDGMEGCVIKPVSKEIPEGCAPFLKVRNPDYLHLIYGYDYKFPKKYERLISKKSTAKKIRVSIAEYKLGEELLRLVPGDPKIANILASMVFEESKEIEIDPRL